MSTKAKGKLHRLFHRREQSPDEDDETTSPTTSNKYSSDSQQRAISNDVPVTQAGGSRRVGSTSHGQQDDAVLSGAMQQMYLSATDAFDAQDRDTVGEGVPERKAVGSDPPRNRNAQPTIRTVGEQAAVADSSSKPVKSRNLSLDANDRGSPPATNKPLPSSPQDRRKDNVAGTSDAPFESRIGREKGYEIQDSKTPIDLTGIVDLRNTVDETYDERYAPAVTHETIVQDVHEIREEVITREIHHHEVFHRILPVIDIEVLPARHFIPIEGGLVEVAEEEVPGGAGRAAAKAMQEAASKMLPQTSATSGQARSFSARTFEASEGDSKAYVTPEGVNRTDTTWVHPPTIETGGRETGQTQPFHMGEDNVKHQGLKTLSPKGNILGVSPLLAQRQREKANALQSSPSSR